MAHCIHRQVRSVVRPSTCSCARTRRCCAAPAKCASRAARAISGHGAEPALARARTVTRCCGDHLCRAALAAVHAAAYAWCCSAPRSRQHGRARRRRHHELGAANRAGPPPSPLLRRSRSSGGAGQQSVGPRRPHPSAGRLRDRVEQAPRAAQSRPRPAAARSSAPRENGPAARRRSRDCARRWSCPTPRCSAWPIVWQGEPWQLLAQRRRPAQEARGAHARRHLERLRTRRRALVGVRRRQRAARPDAAADLLRLEQHAQPGQSAVGFGAGPPGARSSTTSSDSDSDLLRAEYEAITSDRVRSSLENFLYYAAKKYLADPRNCDAAARSPPKSTRPASPPLRVPLGPDVDAQVIELSKLRPERLDRRLADLPALDRLAHERRADPEHRLSAGADRLLPAAGARAQRRRAAGPVRDGQRRHADRPRRRHPAVQHRRRRAHRPRRTCCTTASTPKTSSATWCTAPRSTISARPARAARSCRTGATWTRCIAPATTWSRWRPARTSRRSPN